MKDLTPRTTVNCICATSKIEKLFESAAESTMVCTLCRKTKGIGEKEKNHRVCW